jgi:toxin ParE1/3/4
VKIQWSPVALERASECAAYIAADKRAAAAAWIHELFERVDLLTSTPYMGRVAPELNNARYREILFGNYRVIYSIKDEHIEILTIRGVRQILTSKKLY